jgi:hypothetical protein
MPYEQVYQKWIVNLKLLIEKWEGDMDELETRTNIKKDNLYCILKGTRKAHPSKLLFIAKCINSKPHQIFNIPIES